MKKIILGVSLLMFGYLFITWVTTSPTKEQTNQAKQTYDSLYQKTYDSLYNLAFNRSTLNVSSKNDSIYKDSIQIIKRYTSIPNSAGGVDLNIIWKNKSKRTIKYARFTVKALNAVDDEVFSDIGYSNDRKVAKVTGPIKPGKTDGYGTYWDCIWYNSTIKRCEIVSVELEYMDGTIVEFSI